MTKKTLLTSSTVYVHLLFMILLCTMHLAFSTFLVGCVSPYRAAQMAEIGLPMTYSPYFIVFLVDAPHFDCSSAQKLIQGIYRRGHVGHVWIYLEGDLQGKRIALEGGHSGELGIAAPRYFEQIAAVQNSEADPISCLHKPLDDGFFQKGNGDHIPTFAAKMTLSQKQFEVILEFISLYSFKEYNLLSHQCATFAEQIAALVGLELPSEITLAIEPYIYFGGEKIRFWSHPEYCMLTLNLPDLFEKALLNKVLEGTLENALPWYLLRD